MYHFESEVVRYAMCFYILGAGRVVLNYATMEGIHEFN